MNHTSDVGHPDLVWIEMDRDRSATAFSPRRARIVHRFTRPLRKEAVVVELFPPPWIVLPFPHRVRYVVLQYDFQDQEALSKTFSEGDSYAEILELRHLEVVGKEALTARDIRRLGFAGIYPWPKPTPDEMRKLVRREASP